MNPDIILGFLNRIFKLFNKNNFSPHKKFKLPKRALIIFPDFIGDAIVLTPFLRNLRSNLGASALIDAVCSKSIAEMLLTLPYINHYYPDEYVNKNKRQLLNNRRYDTVFILKPSISWAAATIKERIPQRITTNLERLGIESPLFVPVISTHIIPNTSIKDKTPQIEVNLSMLKHLGMKVQDTSPEINLKHSDVRKAKSLIGDNHGLNAMIHLTAGSPGKQWDIENWLEIIKYLALENYKHGKNYRIFATGAHKDKKIYDDISKKTGVQIINLCGQTTLRETVAVYRHMDLVVTTDSAPAHIAGIAKVPNLVVLYGPTNNHQWFPFAPDSKVEQVYADVPCRPCVSRVCQSKKCLKEITVDDVNAAIDRCSGLIVRSHAV